jgi:hypothetical protein
MTEKSGDHYDVLAREAAYRLADTLAPYRVLTRAGLAELSGATHWATVDFDWALRWGIDHDLLHRLSDDLYETGPAAEQEVRRLRMDGGR